MNKKIYNILLMGVASAFVLSGCGTSDQAAMQRGAQIDSALDRAAYSAAAQNRDEGSLVLLERVYKRNPDDVTAALKYASALRQFDYLNRAAMVLRPFASASNATTEVKNEYAAIQLAQGNYSTAEEFAQQSIIMDAENYEAFHYLGVALDAQGMHEEAERAFRKGLDYWEGDPTTIMNNLALNLATQGHVSEARSILEKALSVAPDRIELQRNLRIISTLDEANARHHAPAVPDVTPQTKPEKKG